jgi:CheY-like chemotaxis protein
MPRKEQTHRCRVALHWKPITFMPLLLVLEDTVAELRTVAASARRAGFDEFENCERVVEARMYLERADAGKAPLPAALLIDLDRGLDAGCEVLRFRNTYPTLKEIPAVIWTLLGSREREICKSFGAVGFVSKDDDPNVLIGELDAILANSSQGQSLRPSR